MLLLTLSKLINLLPCLAYALVIPSVILFNTLSLVKPSNDIKFVLTSFKDILNLPIALTPPRIPLAIGMAANKVKPGPILLITFNKLVNISVNPFTIPSLDNKFP